MKPAIVQYCKQGRDVLAWILSFIEGINGNPIRKIDSSRIYREIHTPKQKIENKIVRKIGKQIETQKFENRKTVEYIVKTKRNKIETQEIENREIEHRVFAKKRILEKNFAIGGPTGTVY